MASVDLLLKTSARRNPEKTAVECAEQKISYGELDALVNQFARYLAIKGVQSGDCVGVILPNSIEIIVALFALARCGAVLVPLNPAFTDHELAFIFSNAGIKTAITRRSHSQRLNSFTGNDRKIRVVEIESLASLEILCAGESKLDIHLARSLKHSLLYTSGTTGRPKGAIVSHVARVHNSLSCMLGYGINAQTRMNCPAPMFHSGGMMIGLLSVIGAGGTVLIPEDASGPATKSALLDQGANFLLTVPTIIRRLVDDSSFCQAALDREFSILHGAAGMPAPLALQMIEEWPKCRPFHGYGSTEALQLTVLSPEEYSGNIGATGRPLPGTEVVVRHPDGTPAQTGEIGEITTAGPHLFSGYLNDPDATSARMRGGVYWTGDRAWVDEAGIITIAGRSAELIISGGFNVYAKEVEDVLHGCEGVTHAAVIGLPDRDWGEKVVAVIQTLPGAVLSESQLQDACSDKLTQFKKPKTIIFVKDMPLNSTGKIEKHRLHELFSNEKT